MIAIEVENYFVVDQLSNTAGILPVNTKSDIALPEFIKVVIHYYVCPALQSVFNKLFNGRQFLFRYLRHIFAQRQSILAEISIEIICLVKFPAELLVLHTVLSKLHSVHLRIRFQGEENRRQENKSVFFLHKICPRFVLLKIGFKDRKSVV